MDKIPVVGSDKKIHFIEDQKVSQANTDALSTQVSDLETSKVSSSTLDLFIAKLDQLEARVLSTEALISELQTVQVTRQDQIALSGVPDASGIYDQDNTQSTVDLVNQLRLTVNSMNV